MIFEIIGNLTQSKIYGYNRRFLENITVNRNQKVKEDLRMRLNSKSVSWF